MELPDDPIAPHPHYPTGSLPRHCTAYTPPSPVGISAASGASQDTTQPFSSAATTARHHHSAGSNDMRRLSPSNNGKREMSCSSMDAQGSVPSSSLSFSPSLRRGDEGSNNNNLPQQSFGVSRNHQEYSSAGHNSNRDNGGYVYHEHDGVSQRSFNNSRSNMSPQLSYASVHSIPPMGTQQHDGRSGEMAGTSRPRLRRMEETTSITPPPHQYQQQMSHDGYNKDAMMDTSSPEYKHHLQQQPNMMNPHRQQHEQSKIQPDSSIKLRLGPMLSRVRGFLKIFARVLVCVIFMMVAFSVYVLESKSSGMLHSLRLRPEVVVFRLQYYQPLKDAISHWVTSTTSSNVVSDD